MTLEQIIREYHQLARAIGRAEAEHTCANPGVDPALRGAQFSVEHAAELDRLEELRADLDVTRSKHDQEMIASMNAVAEGWRRLT